MAKKPNRAQELLDLYGPERGTAQAFDAYMDALVHGSERDSQKWIDEIGVACPLTEIIRAWKKPRKVVALTPESRQRALHKKKMAAEGLVCRAFRRF
jgi:hypothetical protein